MKYLSLLDCSNEVVRILQLSAEETDQLSNCDDAEVFLYTLEEKYDFKMKNCSWMLTDGLNLEIK